MTELLLGDAQALGAALLLLLLLVLGLLELTALLPPVLLGGPCALCTNVPLAPAGAAAAPPAAPAALTRVTTRWCCLSCSAVALLRAGT